MSCHGKSIFYTCSCWCVSCWTISLPNFNGLHCKLAEIALFIYMMYYWVECMTSSVMSFAYLTPFPKLPLDSCHNWPWRALAFVSLLTSSPLTKISIICTQVLQEEKIFPMIPRSEWSNQWSLEYAWKCSEIWLKNSEQNHLWLHMLPLLWYMVNHCCSKNMRKREKGKA